MKDQIQLHELCAYIPYEVECLWYDRQFTMIGISPGQILTKQGNILKIDEFGIENFRLLLRPLSDLTKEIEQNGKKFIPIEELSELIDEYNLGYNDHYINHEDFNLSGNEINWLCEPYFIVEKLFEWHFDIFGLIDQGLAVRKEDIV